MKVFITGITGFIGANFTRYLLERGHEVSGFVRDLKTTTRLAEFRDKISFQIGDLLEKESIREAVYKAKPDVIFHFGVYDYLKNDLEKIFAIGVHSTHHLLEAGKEIGIKMFVNVGSSSEYGSRDHPMREDERIDPNSYYAIGKAAQTHFVSYFSKREKIPAVTLRLFSVYGPLEDECRFIPTLIRSGLMNKNMPLTATPTGRDFIYVEDVCKACEKAMCKTLFGDVINVGSGIQHTLIDAFNEVKRITSSSMIAEFGAYKNREFDTTHWVADPSIAKKSIGFEAKTSFSDGLKTTVDWFQKTCRINMLDDRKF